MDKIQIFYKNKMKQRTSIRMIFIVYGISDSRLYSIKFTIQLLPPSFYHSKQEQQTQEQNLLVRLSAQDYTIKDI